ncbi:MAG TPA: MlaA family lipoprotein, partial [Burkholderiaceae bacterium]|nr:MlaA family lipoprotein [Burkholderiaceae bacterium]
MTPLRLLQRLLLGAAVALAAAGCASVPSETGKDNIDPFERYNRHVFEFNDTIDRNVLVPVAQGYRAVVPGPA